MSKENTSKNLKANASAFLESEYSQERNDILSNLLNVLFEQVKLQQEVRDRWFGHYLTIIGALIALATLCLNFFDNVVQKNNLYIFLCLIFGFACLLGILFYILYLYQRINYKRTYMFLSTIQSEIIKSFSNILSKLQEKSTFTTKRHGADFYTLLIQSLIDSAMLAAGIIFLAISQTVSLRIACLLAAIGFVSMFGILQLIRYLFERKE